MASVISSQSGGTYTYVITDMAGNVATVVAPPPAAAISVNITSGSGLLSDGLNFLATLLLSLATNERPTFVSNAFTN